MQKYNTYLRRDQVDLLKTTQNASEFLRRALDDFVARNPDLTDAEKTIAAYNALKELEESTADQQGIIKRAREEHGQLEEKARKAETRLEVHKEIGRGNYRLEQTSTTAYAIIVDLDGNAQRLGIKADSEEQARGIINKGSAEIITNATKDWQKAEEDLKIHQAFQQSHAKKLEALEKQASVLRGQIREWK